jgi:hypothetical protein
MAKKKSAPRKNPAAVALGRRGGTVRAKNLTDAERSEAARKAVQARWEQERAKREAAATAAKKDSERKGKPEGKKK